MNVANAVAVLNTWADELEGDISGQLVASVVLRVQAAANLRAAIVLIELAERAT